MGTECGGDRAVTPTVIVTRPAESAAELAEALTDLGFTALLAPMLSIEPVVPPPALPDGVQAVLITSANAVDALAAMGVSLATPVLAVGDSSAAAASARGFASVRTASGAGADLVDLVVSALSPEAGPLLWVAGDAVSVALDTELKAHGFIVHRRVGYRSVPAGRLGPEVAAALRGGAVAAVLFFSPRSAEAFATLLQKDGLDRFCATVTAYCMSRAVADAASTLPWRAVRIAAAPTKNDLLETLLLEARATDHAPRQD